MVNDLTLGPAEQVAADIIAAGGQAIAIAASVTDIDAVTTMVERATAEWGGVDILVNNAGILRDQSFAKMELEDFRLVMDVYLIGFVNCGKAVWSQMCDRDYGCIILTTSSSGLYGNFGQSNYSAAKMAFVGLMQTLGVEGERYNVRVNCLVPSASTNMTNGLYSDEALSRLGTDLVSPVVVVLAHDEAPTRQILLAGGSSFKQAHATMTRGVHIQAGPNTAALLASSLDMVADRLDELVPTCGNEQHRYEVELALQAAAIAK